MRYIIYISAAYKLMDEDELMDILTISRINNARKSITGILLYGEGTFIQVLEGDQNDLEQTYAKISCDNRHKGLIKIADAELNARNFPGWSMGFRSLNASMLSELEGFTDLSGTGFLNNADPHTAIKLLKTFVSVNRISVG